MPLLTDVSVSLEDGKLHAIVGPSGCGKSTLMKALLRIMPGDGQVLLRGRPVEVTQELIGKVGLAPQFSVAQSLLTVEESLRSTLSLCVKDRLQCKAQLEHVLKVVGLEAQRDNRVSGLSGGQLRRLGLAMELAPNPDFLICDEVTSGLDPNAESRILELLGDLRDNEGKTLACIIHNLGQLPVFDAVTVLYQGHLVFHGTYPEMMRYFGLESPLELYDSLEKQSVEAWDACWRDKRELSPPPDVDAAVETSKQARSSRPGLISQFFALLARRLRLFFRDRGALALIFAITLGFPIMVVIFAFNGLPAVPSLPDPVGVNVTIQDLANRAAYEVELTQIGTLVIGLVLFQVVLLTLMGSNNGAREIAEERNVYEQERLRGLSPAAYLASKAVFVGLISVVQGAWMAVFVKGIVGFPGDWGIQIATLSMSVVSMAWVCLGFSALMNSPERASLLSVYLVGFQLPLAGIVLELPGWMEPVCRPMINAFWAWSGTIRSMIESRYYDTVLQAYGGATHAPETALIVLILQGLVGLVLAWWGCRRTQIQ